VACAGATCYRARRDLPGGGRSSEGTICGISGQALPCYHADGYRIDSFQPKDRSAHEQLPESTCPRRLRKLKTSRMTSRPRETPGRARSLLVRILPGARERV
jgi:hypothetical protein